MKHVLLSGLTLMSASALVPLGSTAASAQSYERAPQSYEQCVREQRNRQVAGALIGGILGAVVGAELHDDAQDRDRRDYRRGDRHSRRGDRHTRRGERHSRRGDRRRPTRHDRRRHHDEDNDGAVVAGAGVGALAGAALAGRGDCGRPRARQGRYDDRRYEDRQYDDRGYDDRYSNSSYGGQDPYYEEDPYYADQGDTRRYESGSNDELLGGYNSDANYVYEDNGYQSQTYRASSSGDSYSATTGRCRTMTSSGRQTYMCEGSDGIWRPSNSY